ncbi:MAG TPA: hypothetical protein VMZ28_15255 [Kofleriaceae bacterium]|nr:hypothetical protein [Kofleriaceae bacterium]
MSSDDPRERQHERLRQAAALARFWLSQFADPTTFVWRGDRSPQHYACEALDALRDALAEDGDRAIAAGTQQMDRLRPGRAGFIAFHQNLARQALSIGQTGAARAALRALRTSDFVGATVEVHLQTLRDSRAAGDQVTEALHAILALDPAPDRDDLD